MRKFLMASLVLFLMLVVLEGALRIFFGLGNPPLSQTDPTIEYLFKPNQEVRRFGNRIRINEYGMRSDSFPKPKMNPSELRVMVLGDSVINGGNQTDQEQLATELLRRALKSKYPNRSITVGNISAGSWGPPNMLAYINKYGLFDADAVLIVLSSHDFGDFPTFEPLNPNTHPTVPPSSAVSEGWARYLPRLIPGLTVAPVSEIHVTTNTDDIARCLDALREMIELARNNGARVAVVQHWTKTELSDGKAQIGYEEIGSLVRKMNVPLLEDRNGLAESMAAGAVPFRDDIHPNSIGQEILYKTFKNALDHWQL